MDEDVTKHGTDADSGELLVFADEFGLVVHGPSGLASRAIDDLLDGAQPHDARRQLSATEVAAVGATGLALAATSGEYLRLTAESAAKVKEFGEQLDGGGALRGWVKDGNQFAGQLTFDKVSLAGEQAMALQTAAVSLALRSAIADVQKAVEEVSDKVDDVRKHLNARLQGDVVGTYRHLQEVVDRTNRRGHLLDADWDTIAQVGHQLHRDLDTLRVYVRSAVGDVTLDLSVPAREKHFRRFAHESGSVGDMLRLILVSEQSLQLFQYLRLQRVRSRDPEHLSSALDDARTSLRAQQQLDQGLVDQMLEVVDRTRVVQPLEVHRIFSKDGLDREARAFHERAVDFAVSSRTAATAELGEMTRAELADARAELRRRAGVARQIGTGVAREGRDRAKALGQRAWRRGGIDAGDGTGGKEREAPEGSQS